MSILFFVLYLSLFGYGLSCLAKRFSTKLTPTERNGLKLYTIGYCVVYLLGALAYGILAWLFWVDIFLIDVDNVIFVIIMAFAAPVALFIIICKAPEEGSEERNKRNAEQKQSNQETVRNFFLTNKFSTTIQYQDHGDECTLCVDKSSQEIILLRIKRFFNYAPEFIHIKFADIIKCEIDEDGAVIESGGVGRAIVGGVVAGGVGAVVGAVTRKSKSVCSSLNVHIFTSNVDNPQITIPLISNETNRSDNKYKENHAKAENIYAVVLAAMKNVSPDTSIQEKPAPPRISPQRISNSKKSPTIKERLEQLNTLRADGIITDEEYHKQREKILSEL